MPSVNSISVSLLSYKLNFSCLIFKGFQQVQTKNLNRLAKAILERPEGTPLVTISNHSSCIDDPVIFGMWAVIVI